VGRSCLLILVLIGAMLDIGPVLAQSEPTPIRLQLKWRHQFQFAGYYAAIEKGYYREAGLAVDLIQAPETEEPAQVVLRGGAEYGIATSDLVLYRSRGAPVVALAAIFQHSPYVLVAPLTDEIGHIHDLIGRKVMVEHHADELMAYFMYEGIAKDRLELVPHSFGVEAFARGEVAAMSAYSTDEPFLLQQAGIAYQTFSPRAGGIDFYGDTLFTTESELRDNPARVAAFVAASLKGWAYALDHPEEIIDLILSRYSQRHSRAHLRFEAEQTKRLIRHDLVELGYMNPGRWRHIAEIYAELKMMPPQFKLDGFLLRPPGPADLTFLYLAIAGSLGAALVVGLISLRFYQLNGSLRREILERITVEAKLRLREEELLRIADFDALTGVASRRSFLARFDQELARALEHGTALGLLIFDADRFKSVNDNHGHLAGDEALRGIADAAREVVGLAELIGRLGGEEFGVLLPGISAEGTAKAAERLRREVEGAVIAYGTHQIRVTVSVGGANAMPGDTIDRLSARADAALYEAKRSGRNRSMFRAASPSSPIAAGES
jgi:diguanylate cyclase (GGDEF)-like protein